MRSIFIALVVINLVVFAGQWFSRDSSSTAAAVPVTRTPVLEGKSLQLLGETPKEAAKPTSGSTRPKEVSRRSENSPSTMCAMIGPYIQLLQAEYLVERLESMDVDAEIRSVEVPDGVSFWVYLPPEISEKEALRRLHEVQAKRIDSYIIPNGELANGISLGLFNDRAAADQRVKEVQEQGYMPEIREVPRTLSETWVVLPVTEADKVDPEIWLDALRQQPGLEKRQNFCLGVAPH